MYRYPERVNYLGRNEARYPADASVSNFRPTVNTWQCPCANIRTCEIVVGKLVARQDLVESTRIGDILNPL